LVGRIELQKEAFSKNTRIPNKLFEIYAAQHAELMALKEKYGAIVTPEQLLAESA
jgi:phosphoenolpyruvate carboxykinase (GTP)